MPLAGSASNISAHANGRQAHQRNNRQHTQAVVVASLSDAALRASVSAAVAFDSFILAVLDRNGYENFIAI